jgi:DamX protein
LSGKDWYVVVYGNYATQEQAKAAMKELPPALAAAPLQPWIREISAIQADIEKVQQG